MKLLLGAAGALVLTGLLVAQPAEARCYSNGYERVCVRHSYREYDESTVRYYNPPPPYEPPPYVDYYPAPRPPPAPWAYGPSDAWAYDWYR